MSGAEEGNARNGCELTVLGNKPQRRMSAKCVQATTPRPTRRPLRDALPGAARLSLLISWDSEKAGNRKVGSRSCRQRCYFIFTD